MSYGSDKKFVGSIRERCAGTLLVIHKACIQHCVARSVRGIYQAILFITSGVKFSKPVDVLLGNEGSCKGQAISYLCLFQGTFIYF